MIDEINKYFLEQIEQDVASEEMEQIQDLDELVVWFKNFGDMRIRQFEQLIEEYPDNVDIAEKCRLAIFNTKELMNAGIV